MGLDYYLWEEGWKGRSDVRNSWKESCTVEWHGDGWIPLSLLPCLSLPAGAAAGWPSCMIWASLISSSYLTCIVCACVLLACWPGEGTVLLLLDSHATHRRHAPLIDCVLLVTWNIYFLVQILYLHRYAWICSSSYIYIYIYIFLARERTKIPHDTSNGGILLDYTSFVLCQKISKGHVVITVHSTSIIISSSFTYNEVCEFLVDR